MTKDEALDLALEALEAGEYYIDDLEAIVYASDDLGIHEDRAKMQAAITAIKQARALDKKAENARELGLNYEPVLKDNSNYRLDPPVAEPVAWKWHQAPVKTSWGQEMVVADLAIDKDNTVSIYCERDQTNKVEAMFTPPAAQQEYERGFIDGMQKQMQSSVDKAVNAMSQRPWVGLTDEEKQAANGEDGSFGAGAFWAEAKLKQRNI
jgi:hypothetical protein